MIKAVKIIFTCTLLLSFFAKTNASDFNSADTIYVVVADSVNIDTLEIQKEWPQYIKLGKHHIKNPVYVIAEDVVGKDKATVIVLTILTGPIGGHRLYLGTKPIVPIFYTCTLGCVFVLPIIDLFVICFSKDISRFENNDKIIMWAK
ncbi:MAG: hypothetical protein A2X08_01275 [Bacteroidetes bacterium GWA2_32_17]|nr:MAG: hypothetical protein A2X08_01275 [Bacteroidetes bacterium GWA2_32_17]